MKWTQKLPKSTPPGQWEPSQMYVLWWDGNFETPRVAQLVEGVWCAPEAVGMWTCPAKGPGAPSRWAPVEPPEEEEVGFDQGLVDLIYWRSMCADQIGDDLVSKVFYFLYRDPRKVPEEHQTASELLLSMDEETAWYTVDRILKHIGHY